MLAVSLVIFKKKSNFRYYKITKLQLQNDDSGWQAAIIFISPISETFGHMLGGLEQP